jgi:hypothetical protein
MVVVLVLAAGLRWMNTGLERLENDGAVHTLKAIAVARHGKLELLGLPMPYFNFRGYHGPVSIYIYALPLLIKPDPRLARMMTGAAHVVATALIFAIGGRFFGRKAGLVSALLFAVHPEAVFMARGIWNPSLQTPFALAYVWTGLLGYCGGKKWARIAHLPMLTLGGQCHPGTFLLAPITVVLWVSAWRRSRSQRRATVMHALVGAALALLLTMPWMIGVYLDNIDNLGSSDLSGGEMVKGFRAGAEGQSDLHMFTRLYQQLGNWEQNWTQPIQPVLTLVGLVVLLAPAIVRRGRVTGAAVALGYLLPPLLLLALSARYEDHFIWSGYGFAFLVQGVMIGSLLAHRKTRGGGVFRLGRDGEPSNGLRWLGLLVLGLLALTQILFNIRYDLSLGRVSLDEQVAAIETAVARAQASDRGLLLLASDINDRDWLRWEALREGRDARVVRPDRALPLPAEGAVLLGWEDYTGRPTVFSGGEIVQQGFRLSELPAAQHFKPNLIPLEPVRFTCGATVLGFLREDSDSWPLAGQPWTVFMIWRVDELLSENYAVFMHLVDGSGTKYAQVDMPALPVGQQRIGELAMNRMELVVGESLPEDGPLFLHFGMYNDIHSAETLDASGESGGTLGVIQIRAGGYPLARWDDLALVDLVIPDEFQPGPPLEVLVTWRILNFPAKEVKLRWRLISDDSEMAYETETEIVPGHATISLPAGLLTTMQYRLPLGAAFPPGDYTLWMVIVSRDGEQSEGPFSTSLKVVPRKRLFSVPEMQHRMDADFSGQMTLLGYDIAQHEESIDLTLYWQAQREMETDYKYFVHLWSEGQVVAQVDAMPRGNEHPTSWWAEGEVLRESVQLTLPGNGDFTLTTGFYDPLSAARLAVVPADGKAETQDWVDLGKWAIAE